MKRVELIRRARRAAGAAGLHFGLVRQGGSHEIWACGETRVTLPRHREINEQTVARIAHELEGELGRDWWKR